MVKKVKKNDNTISNRDRNILIISLIITLISWKAGIINLFLGTIGIPLYIIVLLVFHAVAEGKTAETLAYYSMIALYFGLIHSWLRISCKVNRVIDN